MKNDEGAPDEARSMTEVDFVGILAVIERAETTVADDDLGWSYRQCADFVEAAIPELRASREEARRLLATFDAESREKLRRAYPILFREGTERK